MFHTRRLIAFCFLFNTSTVFANDAQLTEDEFFSDIPIVLTASRLVQPLNEVPVAVTVIDREMIEASGFTEISDIFRLVPGFVAGYYRANNQIVGNFFLNDSLSRRMQVLVDGRSIYTPGVGGPAWSTLPLNIDDIERIEVVRGPNAVTYGSNSFTGVISIITRDPLLESGSYFRTNLGENGLKEGTFRYSNTNDDLSYRLSLWYQGNDGFDHQFDGRQVRHLSGRMDYRLSDNDLIKMQFGISDGALQRNEPSDNSTPEHYNDVSANFQMIKWEHVFNSDSELYVRLYRNEDKHVEEFSLQNVPIVGTLPYDQNYKSERLDLEFQMTQRLFPSLNIAWGGSTRTDKVVSRRFLGVNSPTKIKVHRAFINAAWNINDKLLLNSGMMVEKTNITGDSYSPLLSLHYNINKNNSIRLSMTEASRIPVALEEFTDVSITIPPPFNITNQIFFDKKDLDAETISSRSIGLVGHYPEYGIEYDINYSHHKLKNIFTVDQEAFPTDVFDGTAAFLDDRDSATIRSAQASVRYASPGGSRIIASYAHTTINASDLNNADEFISNAGPKHNFSLLGIYKVNNLYTASAGYYYLGESRYIDGVTLRPEINRLDLRLARKIKSSGLNGEIALVGQNITGDEDAFYEQNKLNPKWYLSLKLHH